MSGWLLAVVLAARGALSPELLEQQTLVALGKIADPEPARVVEGIVALESLAVPLADGLLSKLLHKHSEAAVRARAAAALARLPWPADLEALELRVAALGVGVNDPVADVRRAVFLALAAYPLPQSVRFLPKRPRADDTAAVAEARRMLKDPAAAARLTAFLAEEGEAPSTAELPVAQAAAALVSAATAEDAAEQLGLIATWHDPAVVRPFLQFATRSKSASMVSRAIEIMRDKPVLADEPLLRSLMRADDVRLATLAVQALGNRVSPEVAAELGRELVRASERYSGMRARRNVDDLVQALGAALRKQVTADVLAPLEPALRTAKG
jgi:hypothetical protein